MARASAAEQIQGMTSAGEQSGDGGDAEARPAAEDGSSEGASSPTERIRGVLEAYHEAFDAGTPRDLLPLVHRPCTVVTRWGAYVLADRQEIASAFTSVQRDLQARGCQRTERRDVRVQLLDDRLARARVLAVRFDGEDREMERAGSTYVLRRTQTGWRIAVLVEHAVGEDMAAEDADAG